MLTNIESITQQAYTLTKELIEVSKMKEDQLLVIGCSTSEVAGQGIGSYSSPEVAEALFQGIYKAAKEAKVFLASQCCEHLNRALILEAEAAEKYGYEEVNVVPQPKAGGSFATAAYKALQNPVAVEHIRAHVVCARTRAKFIGGVRAMYNEEKM